jgi:hypothetical protein
VRLPAFARPAVKAAHTYYVSLRSAGVLSIMRSVLTHTVSLAVVVLSLALAVALAVLSVVLRMHKHARTALVSDHRVAFCYMFMYFFPCLISYIIPWTPPWAPVCLFYAFLGQIFCTEVRGA